MVWVKLNSKIFSQTTRLNQTQKVDTVFTSLRLKCPKILFSARWKKNTFSLKDPILSQEFIENPSNGLKLVCNTKQGGNVNEWPFSTPPKIKTFITLLLLRKICWKYIFIWNRRLHLVYLALKKCFALKSLLECRLKALIVLTVILRKPNRTRKNSSHVCLKKSSLEMLASNAGYMCSVWWQFVRWVVMDWVEKVLWA